MIREGNVKVDRLNDMEQYILQTGTSSLEELCQHYRVSMSTIRRDIAERFAAALIDEFFARGAIAENAVVNVCSEVRKFSDRCPLGQGRSHFAAGLILVDLHPQIGGGIDDLCPTARQPVSGEGRIPADAAALRPHQGKHPDR